MSVAWPQEWLGVALACTKYVTGVETCDAVQQQSCNWQFSHLFCVTICLYFVICSGFEAPCPEYCLVGDISNFIAEVHRSLKLGYDVNCSFSIAFRTDVFNFLFKGKGSVPPIRQGNFHDFSDFSNVYFPHDWYVVDKLGNRCKVVFPVRLESKVSTVKSLMVLLYCSQKRTEMVYVSLVKMLTAFINYQLQLVNIWTWVVVTAHTYQLEPTHHNRYRYIAIATSMKAYFFSTVSASFSLISKV